MSTHGVHMNVHERTYEHTWCTYVRTCVHACAHTFIRACDRVCMHARHVWANMARYYICKSNTSTHTNTNHTAFFFHSPPIVSRVATVTEFSELPEPHHIVTNALANGISQIMGTVSFRQTINSIPRVNDFSDLMMNNKMELSLSFFIDP